MRIEKVKFKPLFYDEDGNPRFNKLYDARAAAEAAGYEVPKDKEVHSYFLKKVRRALNKLKNEDKTKFPFITVKKIPTLWGLKAFVSVRLGKRQYYGFTTNPVVFLKLLEGHLREGKGIIRRCERLLETQQKLSPLFPDDPELQGGAPETQETLGLLQKVTSSVARATIDYETLRKDIAREKEA